MHRLIEEVFLASFGFSSGHDGHVWPIPKGRIATTTDGYVVRPMFFPGGDIGSLAVHGTVNDLAMCGARPISLTAGFIIEEGTEIATLQRIARSMARACQEVGIAIVAGDTKVVERGKGDGVYITTSGIGVCEHSFDIHPRSMREGDAVVLSGDVGRHGIAVLGARGDFSFDSEVESDSCELWTQVAALLDDGIALHCLRDLTRGGLATTLNELASESGLEIEIEERAVAVRDDVKAACELLGLDPLHVANEGRWVAVVPASQAHKAVESLARVAPDQTPVVAGTVRGARPGQVSLRTRLGTLRHLPMLSGEQLPRIC